MKRVLVLLIMLALGAGAGIVGHTWWIERTIEETPSQVTLFGNVEIRDVQLAFNGENHITEVFVEEGDEVQAGDVVATLETDRLEAALVRAQAELAAQNAIVRRLENGTRQQEIEQARAEVNAAKARVQNSERTVKRLEKTAVTGASSEQDLDNVRAELRVEQATLAARKEALNLAVEGPRQEDIEQAKAQRDVLQAGIEELKIRLKDSRLCAPSPGIIQSRLREPGEFVTPSVPVVTLALMDPKWVRAYLPEPDLGRVKMSLKASVRSDSFPDTDFDGWVGFISPRAEFTPKAVETTDLRTKLVYEIRVYVRDPDNRLRLGQPVTVVIDTASEPRLNDRATPAQGSADAGAVDQVAAPSASDEL